MTASPTLRPLLDRGILVAILMIWLAGLTWVLWPIVSPQPHAAVVSRLIAGWIEHQLPNRADVEQLTHLAPQDPWTQFFQAQLAIRERNHQAAIDFFQQLPRDAGRWELISELSQARRYEVLGRLELAEQHYRAALVLNPDHLDAYSRLGHLLQIEGRTWEAIPLFQALIVRGKCRGDELLGAVGTERFFRSDALIETSAMQAIPPDALIRIAQARRAFFGNDTSQAEAIFREVLLQIPQSGEAQGRWGRIIVDRGDLAEFLAWRGSLPDDARAHPEVWFVQGLKARQLDQIAGAARCYLEALTLDPNHLGANNNLAGCLQQLGQIEAAKQFRHRAEVLSELDSLINLVRESSDRQLIARIATLQAELGRYWEACGWSYVLRQYPGAQVIPEKTSRAWLQQARRSDAWIDPATLPATTLNLQDFPHPQWPQPATLPPGQDHQTVDTTAWKFTDDAQQLGVNFTYFEGTREENRLEHIFNVMGGGLGSVDYDGDGWPDLYIAQANNWRDSTPQPQWQDRLFRNQTGHDFHDVTSSARLGDTSFSHGVTVGDYNQDGFPDLYVGNKGPNRLYHNNGDGTFTETTSAAMVAGNDWTTSSVFADFNQDGLPDLYVLNYTLIDETARKECGTPDVRKACTPDVLPPADDRLYLNLGTGQFRDITQSAGLTFPDGKGLGVVAWDFDQTGRLGLFIANDTTPDLLLVNTGNNAEGIPQFQDEALVRGLAFDTNGNAQASMGVAAGDITGDGRMDLCLTDFLGSAIALYSQRADGFFDDITRRYGLHEPSLRMLGFGCHFGDLDGDGWDDLIVTNGHVDQPSQNGTSDRMRPQIFHNQQGQRFVEVPAERLGLFFQQGYLGRGLALWDWNRDGRTDAAISHLHAPVAILSNRTTFVGKPLVVRLTGRTGCREPTGARVTLLDSLPPQVRMQTAGDGFLVTNERRLLFSVPGEQPYVNLQVQWPEGKTQNYSKIPANSEVLLIEANPEAVILQPELISD